MPILEIQNLTHHYAQRKALDNLSLSINQNEIFGLLGPNGSGKTTLFRILSTLIPLQQGAVVFQFPSTPSPARAKNAISPSDSSRVGEGRGEGQTTNFPTQDSALSTQHFSLPNDKNPIRHHLAVVFQSPSLDKQLTAEENLRHHGHLYGLRGQQLEDRIDQMLTRVGLADRPREFVGAFSGGMRRRVELAKGLLTRPKLLLLDEPSTGLDPGARIDLWRYLREIRQQEGVTILLTTHLMDEADQCDRLAIMDSGRLAACDTPAALKSLIGADVITLQLNHAGAERSAAQDLRSLAEDIRARFDLRVEELDGALRIERQRGHEFIPQLVEAFVGRIASVSLGKPTLEDVFIHVTGHAFRDAP